MSLEAIEIPVKWKVEKLGTICQTTSGGTPNRSNKSYYNGKIPWVKSGELDKGVIYDTEEKITEEAIKNSSAKVFPAGTLLIALYGATIGKLSFLGVDAATNQAVCGIFKNDTINSKYLYYYLYYKRPSLIKQGIGGAQPNISQGILKSLEIPFPPLGEQEKIVLKIEELIAEIESAKLVLTDIFRQLSILRHSVLKHYFKGTNYSTVGELFDFVGGGTPSKENLKYWNGNIPWASVKDIKGNYLNSTVDYITEEGLNNSASNLANPDDVILITRINPGKPIITNIKSAINQDLKIVKPKFETTSKYIYYLLLSIERDCIKKSSGTTVLGINLHNLKEIIVPSFDLTKQNEIVNNIESRFSVSDKIEDSVHGSLSQLEALKQSVLKQAFEGKLV